MASIQDFATMSIFGQDKLTLIIYSALIAPIVAKFITNFDPIKIFRWFVNGFTKITKYKTNNFKTLEIIGLHQHDYGRCNIYNSFPEDFKSIMWFLYKNKVGTDYIKTTTYEEPILYHTDDYIKFDPENSDILVLINKFKNTTSCPNQDSEVDKKEFYLSYTITITLKAPSKIDLSNYLKSIVKQYKEYINKDQNGKIYCFILKGFTDNCPKFETILLNNVSKSLNGETFNTLYHDHKNVIRSDIKLLKNKQYFIKYGLRRKKGYLFHGEPGNGKTASVMAIANEDNRHIMQISLKLINKAADLRTILNLTQIGDISFTKDQIIYLFDEIKFEKNYIHSEEMDMLSLFIPKILEKEKEQEKEQEKKQEKDKQEKDKKEKDKKETQLDMGEVLSMFDGIGSHDGSIIIATTNNKEDLHEALYRDMRLTPMYFTYINNNNLEKMAKDYYIGESIVSSEEWKWPFTSEPQKLSCAKARNLTEINKLNFQYFIRDVMPFYPVKPY